MLNKFKQNTLFLIFIILTANALLLTTVCGYVAYKNLPASTIYDIIDCADGSGQIHKCIRIDSKAGEVNDAAKGASYRVIFGH